LDVDDLFAKHQVALLRYLTRFAGDPEIAADAAQDAYLRLLDSPPRNTNNVRAWLFTVATNLVRDGWKRKHRDDRLVNVPGRALVADQSPDPHAAVEQAERVEIARRMLAKLSERERTILLMWVEGFKHREIAEVVGTTTKTISPTIARAIRKLAGDVEQYLREIL
jgi:RNA polymerase sigma factor (sigma-70 family)